MMNVKVTGIVVEGLGLGKKEFVPTANIDVKNIPASVEFGIYVCTIIVDKQLLRGVLHYGPRLSVDNEITFEVHILNFDKQVYDEKVEVVILNKLRDVEEFATFEELKVQIMKDVSEAEEYFEKQRFRDCRKGM